MSTAAKRRVLVGVAAVVVVLGAGLVYSWLGSRISDRALAERIEAGLDERDLVSVVSVKPLSRSEQAGGKSVLIEYSAGLKSRAPLFERVETESVLREKLGVDPKTSAEERRLLASKDADRVLKLAGLGGSPADPFAAVLLRRVVETDASFEYRGSILANRVNGKWTFPDVEGAYADARPAGGLRSSFPKDAIVVDDPVDMERLKTMVETHARFLTSITGARAKLEELRAADRAKRRTETLARIGSGRHFGGTASNLSDGATVPLYLEIVRLDAGAPGSGSTSGTLAGLLRNDGGWQEARPVTGQWRVDPEFERWELELHTKFGDRVRGAGPILSLSDSWTMRFSLSPEGGLSARTQTVAYELAALSDEELTKARQEIGSAGQKLRAAVSPTATYAVDFPRGVVSRALLRFGASSDGGEAVIARLIASERNWSRSFKVTLNTNKYRTDDPAVEMKSAGRESVREANRVGDYMFGSPGELTLALMPDGEDLVASNTSFGTLRFRHLTADEVSRIEAEERARRERIASCLSPGTSWDGTAVGGDRSIARVRLRFTALDLNSGTVDAVLESLEQPGVLRRFTGVVAPASGSIILNPRTGVIDRSGVLRFPYFSSETDMPLELNLTEREIEGTAYSWNLKFAVADASQVAMPPLPSLPGAYVLQDGKWVRLPRNNGKVGASAVQTTLNVVSGLNNIIGALGGKQANETATAGAPGERISQLTFDGTDPLPRVAGDGVLLLHVGPIDSTAVQSANRYASDLKGLRLMDVAPTRLEQDGRRRLDLLRVVPGIAAFGVQGVAGRFSEPAPGALLFTPQSSLDPGTYAVGANSVSYEFEVR